MAWSERNTEKLLTSDRLRKDVRDNKLRGVERSLVPFWHDSGNHDSEGFVNTTSSQILFFGNFYLTAPVFRLAFRLSANNGGQGRLTIRADYQGAQQIIYSVAWGGLKFSTRYLEVDLGVALGDNYLDHFGERHDLRILLAPQGGATTSGLRIIEAPRIEVA